MESYNYDLVGNLLSKTDRENQTGRDISKNQSPESNSRPCCDPEPRLSDSILTKKGTAEPVLLISSAFSVARCFRGKTRAAKCVRRYMSFASQMRKGGDLTGRFQKAKAPSITRGLVDTKRRLPDTYYDKWITPVVKHLKYCRVTEE